MSPTRAVLSVLLALGSANLAHAIPEVGVSDPSPTIAVTAPDPNVIWLTGGQVADTPGSTPSTPTQAATGPGGPPPDPALIPPICPPGFTPGFGLQSFCIQPGPAAAPAPPPPTPAQVASEAWQHEIPLPHPTLTVAPGEAMVGRLAFLQLAGPQAIEWSGVALGVPVEISATSTYVVNWGDGTSPDAGITSQGGPWPNGTITHAYQNAGNFTITATQRWTATWNAGGATGTITNALFTTGTLALPAREVQANRDQ